MFATVGIAKMIGGQGAQENQNGDQGHAPEEFEFELFQFDENFNFLEDLPAPPELPMIHHASIKIFRFFFLKKNKCKQLQAFLRYQEHLQVNRIPMLMQGQEGPGGAAPEPQEGLGAPGGARSPRRGSAGAPGGARSPRRGQEPQEGQRRSPRRGSAGAPGGARSPRRG
jgi:hypothetical protein